MCFEQKTMEESPFAFTWFAFILGFVTAVILMWAIGRVIAWLKSAFKPPSDKPLGQKVAFSARKLASALLLLTAMAAAAYIAYTILLR